MNRGFFISRAIFGVMLILVLGACSSTEKAVKPDAGPPAVELSYHFSPPELPLKKITNTIGMDFVFIPPGEFVLGSPLTEPERRPDETPHVVVISTGYYIQTTEVTQGQWKQLTGENPSYFSQCGENCPVETVSWEDVQKFIDLLNRREGHNKYRLPTEAEWEYACRAGTTTPFSYGQCLSTDQANYNDLNDQTQYKGCPCTNVKRGKTIPVASLASNPWGIYDMHGNVWEWCQDWMGEYPAGVSIDPAGSFSGEKRIYRGGGQNDRAGYCRSALRGQFMPYRRSGSLGFRLVMNP